MIHLTWSDYIALSGPQNHAIILLCSRDYWIMYHHSFDMTDKEFKYGFQNYVKFIVVTRYGLATAEEKQVVIRIYKTAKHVLS